MILVPYSLKPVKKNKKMESMFKAKNLNLPPDSERSETFEALIPAYFPFTGLFYSWIRTIAEIVSPEMRESLKLFYKV
jgi:hypothetical protein